MKPVVSLGLSAWVVLHLALGSLILALQLRLDSCEDARLTTPQDALWRVGLGGACVLLSALSCAAYLYVSFRAPRPWEFHGYGVFLLLMPPGYLTETLQGYMMCAGFYGPRLGVLVLFHALLGLRNIIFAELLVRKVRVLGLGGKCTHPVLLLRSSQVMAAVFVLVLHIPYYTWSMVDFEGWMTLRLEGIGGLRGTGRTLNRILRVIAPAGFFAYVFLLHAVVISVWLLIRSVLIKLGKRNASKELVTKLRNVLKRHFRGAFAALVTKVFVLFAVSFGGYIDDRFDLPASLDEVTKSWAYLLDCAGDLAGVLLLSGLGSLLLSDEDPDKGDVTRLFRSLVHSAVLTIRGDHVFEGRIAMTRSRRCIVSFPGKFISEWHSLTWLCEQGDLSSACVFLPTSDPQNRFGKHVENPENTTRCWCHTIYGDVKPWGCMWFDAWKKNVEEAVRLHLDLVVVYFPGEAGHGEVAWQDLATTNLWDGVGMGGSQKAEVAFLVRSGIPFLREDLTAFRLHTHPS